MATGPQSPQGPEAPPPTLRRPLLDSDAARRRERERAALPWFCVLAPFFFITGSGVADYPASRRLWTASFVLGASASLSFLLGVLSNYATVPPEDAGRRRRLGAVMWVLAASLNLTIWYRVGMATTLVPPAACASAAVWCLAALLAIASFWVLVVRPRGDKGSQASCCSEGSPDESWVGERA